MVNRGVTNRMSAFGCYRRVVALCYKKGIKKGISLLYIGLVVVSLF